MAESEENADKNQVPPVTIPEYRIRSISTPREWNDSFMKLIAESLSKSSECKDVAERVRAGIASDGRFNSGPGKGAWQCVVGKEYGVSVSHEPGHAFMVDLVKENISVLIYKSADTLNSK